MKKAVAVKEGALPVPGKSAARITYPAVADSVDLPDLTFLKGRDEDGFVLAATAMEQSFFRENTPLANRVKGLDGVRLTALLGPLWPGIADSDTIVNIVARRAALLTVRQDGVKVVIDMHWNLLIPYFYRIKELPVAHPEILDLFARAVFHYAALAMTHRHEARDVLRSLVIDAYLGRPQFLLASLDIFNKPGIYHIHPTRVWLDRISAANDEHRLEIDGSAAATLVKAEFLEEVIRFVHKIVKNYAFRYVDYLWTQQYRISISAGAEGKMATCEGDEIVIAVRPLLDRGDWKPALYLSLGYAIILAILRSSGETRQRESAYLAMMKTWNRYLSFDKSVEQQSVQKLCGLPGPAGEGQRRRLMECMAGSDTPELIDDFIVLTNYSSKETFAERLKVLNEPRRDGKTGAYYEQLLNTVSTFNTTLKRNNISYSKLIEILRNDNIDHLQLVDLLRTGRLDNRSIVDVNEWLLLRTLLYDLINAPKVFKNDYKMLLKVLTKVNKSLIVYIWTLILDNDVRYELINSYIVKLIVDIFAFDRVKIYEIVADPLECMEAEAVTGYLLNWAGLSLEKWRSILGGPLSRMPRNVVTQLSVQTVSDVDQLIPAMTVRASGLIGFYLHEAYHWGSTRDELTERIRSYFPELLAQARKALHPRKAVMGGAMLLLILAQIISDERDGFARGIVITEEDRQTVLDLISQCIDWDQRHFVMVVAGIAAGYTGNIDGWMLRQFDTLLGRYGGGDRVVLRSVVQSDVESLVERTLTAARRGEERESVKKIQLLRQGVDPVISNRTNKVLAELATRHGIRSPETVLKRKDIGEFVLLLSRLMKA